MPGRRRPVGQHREGLVAGATTAPPNPDLLVPFVVRIFEALSVTDDGPLAANRAQPGEQLQRDLGHPGSVLFSGSGSAIKRITAGVKAGPDRRCQVSIWGLAFTLQGKSVPNEKRILRSDYRPQTLAHNIGRFKTTIRSGGLLGVADHSDITCAFSVLLQFERGHDGRLLATGPPTQKARKFITP